MTQYVRTLPDFEIDLKQLLEEYGTHIVPLMGYWDGNDVFKIQKKFHLKKRNEETKSIVDLMPYTKELSYRIKKFTDYNQMSFRMVMPNKSYAWHVDPQTYNYHIPLITNTQCYFSFLDGDKHLPAGKLYCVQTNVPHTFVNNSLEMRVHLMFEKMYGAK